MQLNKNEKDNDIIQKKIKNKNCNKNIYDDDDDDLKIKKYLKYSSDGITYTGWVGFVEIITAKKY